VLAQEQPARRRADRQWHEVSHVRAFAQELYVDDRVVCVASLFIQDYCAGQSAGILLGE
jgi:hypothetical protein